MNSPDDKLIERILIALEDGTAERADELAKVVDASAEEVAAALRAIDGYDSMVSQLRERRLTPTDDDDPEDFDDELAIGTQLGDYHIRAILGRGGMGTVYRATQTSLRDREVALKVLPSALARRDPRYHERFRREAGLAAELHHPNIAQVYGFEKIDGHVCFAMRLIEGRTLQEVITSLANRQATPVRTSSREYIQDCATLVHRVSGALAEVHARGLIHRDIKPSNIILEGSSDMADERAMLAAPVLVDFGLAKPTGDTELTGTQTMVGTLAFTSYEAHLGRGADARSDVFSLGVVLHDLLTRTSSATRGPAVSGMADLRAVNPTIDPRLAAIVEMTLQENPELRYRDGGALFDELDRYLRGEEVRALPSNRISRFLLWRKREPARASRLLAITALAFALLTSAGWIVGANAITATRIAERCESAFAAGDLVTAAQEGRELRAMATPWMWWLQDAMTTASLVDQPPESSFGRAIRQLRSARLNEPTEGSEARGRAADRLCEVLFDADMAALWPSVKAFLHNELLASDQERRRLAASTWANYLLVAPDEQEMPAGLVQTLTHQLKNSKSVDERRSVMAALGTIRQYDTWLEIVRRVNDPDPEIARLAYSSSASIYSWLHLLHNRSRSADPSSKTEWSRITPNDMATFARAIASYNRVQKEIEPSRTEIGPGHWLGYNARLCGWYEKSPESKSAPLRRIPVDEELRLEIRNARDELQAWWDANQDDVDDHSDDRQGATEKWRYRSASGRAAMLHDGSLWSTAPLQPADSPTRRGTDPDAGNLVAFNHSDRKKPLEARLYGTAIGAVWAGAALTWDTNRETSNSSHLRMTRPGRSRLRVTSRVPEGATRLIITIRHYIGSRNELAGKGFAVYRGSITGSRFEQIAQAPGTRKGRGVNSALSSFSELTIPDGLLPQDSIEFVLEYLYGNTTYWIRGIEFEWTT